MVHVQVKVYIAHTFKHRKFVKETLCPLIYELGIKIINPFYEQNGTTKRKEVEMADKMETQGIQQTHSGYPDNDEWIQMLRTNDNKIVTRDLNFIKETDFTVAYMTDISCGTTCEIFYTGYILNRPVFLLTDNPAVYQHPWIISSCKKGKICRTKDELILALKRKYC